MPEIVEIYTKWGNQLLAQLPMDEFCRNVSCKNGSFGTITIKGTKWSITEQAKRIPQAVKSQHNDTYITYLFVEICHEPSFERDSAMLATRETFFN